ncbi:hypothetical protein B0T22DRAFT_478623 [Podospora appendiculata]|uniref:Sulphur transport domain-containing protein n=1 Tax=Podospora appendiculata TaxID=314037 RepID=A0AAE0X6Z2_9PEZI|nr:hypothetical protein B0T22DRAFT_478623 [Podospora appendiculata]
MDTLISGAAFGAALTASGVFQPSVIISQLQFTNFHMIQAFLTAAASSALIVTVSNKLNYAPLSPRGFSTLDLFAPYDGNIIGGLLLGAGMLLAGSCPGTVLAQVGVGVRSGIYSLEGAVVGGILYTGFIQPWIAARRKRFAAAQAQAQAKKKEAALPLTVHEALGVSRTTVFLGLEAMFAAIVAAAALLTTPGPEAKISPVAGGLCIAAAQLLSLAVRRTLVGTSTAFEEVGEWFWGAVKAGDVQPRRYKNLLFTSGMVAGAWLLSRAYPVFAQTTPVAIAPLASALGGCLMVIGSRIAGGCTSGHGITGISLLSTSSFITIGCAFAAGGVLGLIRG